MRWPAIAGHLDWIDGVLGGERIPAARRAELGERLRVVQARAADPLLRIAVFGEASSGKSTLLNGFVRRRLLPSSNDVTTRTTTVLRQVGGAEALVATVSGRGDVSWPSGSFTQWTRPPGPGSSATLEQALQRVLTTSLAEQVLRLEVRQHARLLGDGIVLLDTPGFSVVDRGHRELAEAAVRQADLALVVVPATAAMSMTLVDFLSGPLHDHLDRCAFVLTKTDLLDPDDIDDVTDLVERRLHELGVAEPVVLPCAPGRALAALTAGTADGGGAPDAHVARFLAVERRIAELAAGQRQSAVAATVLGLLSGLLAAVEETAGEQRVRLAAEREALGRLSLPDFPAFLDHWTAGALRGAERALDGTTLLLRLDAAIASLDAEVVEAVAGDRIAQVNDAAAAVSRLVRERLRRDAQNTVDAAAGRAAQALRGAADELARDFGRQYSALAGLAGERRTAAPVTLSAAAVPAPDLSATDEALARVGSQLALSDNWRTGGGAAAGALAGSLVAPVVGTIVGGILGAIIGKRGPDAAREQFLAQARPIIAEAQETVAEAVTDAVGQVGAELGESVVALRARYLTQWSEEIARLNASQARRQAALAQKIAAAERIALEARRRRTDIASLRHDIRRTPASAKE